MPILGVTGGVASGKSTVVRLLAERLSSSVFDADAAVHDLLDNDRETQREIAGIFPECVGADGSVSRETLRGLVFQNPAARIRLESILHPRVREQWTTAARRAAALPGWFLVDIPLLFETQAERVLGRTLLVAASVETQMKRLVGTRGLRDEVASSIIAAQWSLVRKLPLATHVAWNDGSLDALTRQADILASYLSTRHG